VAVTSMTLRILLTAFLTGVGLSVHAAVLPEDRSDLMYHYYDGGGVTVHGPALLVRQRVNDAVSLSGHYYMDMVSGASIDVVTTASPYKDTRNEYGVGVDYLRANSIMSARMTQSKENDYTSDSFSLGVSHELFNGLTTLSLGYGQSQDTIGRVNESFLESADRYNFRIGVSQILSKTSLFGFAFEGVTDDGYLSNPYRVARVGVGGATAPENYPRTRDSQAFALRYLYGFSRDNQPVQRSLRLEYRYFQDTWDIHAHTLGFGIQRMFGPKWLGEFRYRYYTQTAASFYSDNFPVPMTYMARDKELSTFNNHSFGIKAGWKFSERGFWFFNRASLNFSYDYIRFDYKDFTDVRNGEAYSFGANVVQIFVSGWY
jgi:hypothetical protein